MYQRGFHLIGWIILIGMLISWITIGYSNWYLLSLPLAHLAFSVSSGTIKKLTKFSLTQIIIILFALAISVAIVLGLIQVAKYVINDLLHLKGWVKSVSQVIAIIVALYPVKFTFGSIVYKLINYNKEPHDTSHFKNADF